MNRIKILVLSLLILGIILAGAVSASELSGGSDVLVQDDALKTPGVKYALLVGVSTYQDPSNNLEGVRYDAPHMQDMLINDCGYASSRITTLNDGQATKSAIRSALILMSSRVGPDDTLVFYFSGHGYVYPSYYGTSYLEPYDTRSDTVTNDISSSELKQWLDNIECKNLLVVIDACEAEGMLKGDTKELVKASQVQVANDIQPGPGPDRFSQNFLGPFEGGSAMVQSSAEQQKALSGNQYVVLVSCRSGEGSWTNALTGSWFTTYFVEGVGSPSADKNSDAWVSAEEAYYYASPLTTGKHYDQHPVIYDGDPLNDLLMAFQGSTSTGSIDVTSSPSGALVYLDGTSTGYTTPVTLSGVTAGSHTVRCTMTGYTEKSQDVTVNAGQATSVSLTLQSQALAKGSVVVSSTPAGARIYLDGTDTGYITPRTISGVTAGTHTVRCSMTGYTDKSQTVTVVSGRSSVVRLSLSREEPVTGSISVSSSPSGALVYLDGTSTGYTTPVTLPGVTAGSHTVRCTMTGYTEKSQAVTVVAGQTTSVSLTLQSQAPATGSIVVSSTPAGARIYLDGTDTGYITPRTISGVTAGTHTVRCSMTGYTDKSTTVRVTAGRTSTVSLSLTSQGPVTGSVYVGSSPSGAKISIDGTDTGQATPATLQGISAGSHTVSCSLNGYTGQSQAVTVVAGQTSSVMLTLSAQGISTGSIYVTSQPTRASVYVDGNYLGMTPLTFSSLAPGTHTVRVTKQGYRDATRSVTVTAGTKTTVYVVLSKGW